jgi:uncharacterized protein YnzC (UPF0291/DUF896 family)
MSQPSVLEKSSMTAATLVRIQPIGKLLPIVPDSDLSRLIREGYLLAESFPEILKMIDRDRDAAALQKKRERIEDQVWLSSRGSALPGFDVSPDEEWRKDLELQTGRPRMPAVLVLVFMLVRGYFGGFKNRKATMLLLESKSMEAIFASLNMPLPGASTIIDNVNIISEETLGLILDAQIQQCKFEKLDDFKELTVDSTHVEANSAWPTDSGTIAGLAARSEHLLRELTDFGIELRIPAIVRKLVIEVENLHKQIQLSSGKKDSAIKRKKYYRRLIKLARKIRQILLTVHERAETKALRLDLMPSIASRLKRQLQRIAEDLANLSQAVVNAKARVLDNKKVLAENKVLSVSDQDAAMIVKGGREPAMGFKPQVGRSENGLVTAIIVPEGNAADSDQLRSIVDASTKRTGIVPRVLSFDDGYTNKADRDHYLLEGTKIVSFSGSKGKRLIPPEEYDSAAYAETRNSRSAVESLMFVLKHNHDFDRLMRRGINSARAELTEKAIAHNFFRMIALRQAAAATKLRAA